MATNGNKLIIAAAGSGKTTHIVEKALEQRDGRVLITTYTLANEAEIRNKIIEKNKCIPDYITVQTWFSFLLQHGARPYQGNLYDKKIKGLVLMNQQSAPYTKESDIERHYFTEDGQNIYSDKLSKFVVKCNEFSKGDVIDRISRIYSHIFIDEVQDLAGHDLELLKLLFGSNISTLLVGDPRQSTYSTNNSSKNRRFRKKDIVSFFESNSIKIEKDDTTLITNYRCAKPICDLSNKLYPDLPQAKSGNSSALPHTGVFSIKRGDVNQYLEKYRPTQLRFSSTEISVNKKYPVMTFGDSKGLSFDRVLIYPTKDFVDWLKNNNKELAPTTRSKYYVAITRARYSVGIVCAKESNLHSDSIIQEYNSSHQD